MNTGHIIMYKKELLLPMILIIIFGFSIYVNVINAKFIWDDNLLVVDNIYIRNWSGLIEIFTRDIGAGAGMKFNYYRPLQISSYKLEHAFWGFDHRGYHVTNIALHLLVALCIFYLAILLFADRLFAFLAGLIFVSHPIQTETVAYISNRGDLLCALFFILSFILYIRYIKYKSTSIYLLMIISYLFSILSKENALIFIGALFIYHYTFKEKLRIRQFLPIFAVTIMYIVLRGSVLKSILPKVTNIHAIFARLPGFFSAITIYLRLLFFPFGLHFDYGNKTFQFTDPQAILGIILTSLLITYAIVNRKKNTIIFFSVFWFLLMLIPVSSIYPITAFYMAEHYLYIPSIGFAFILSNYLIQLYRDITFKMIAVSIITALLVFYGYSTIKQNNYWLEPIDFYLKTLSFTPDSPVAYYNLGKEYEKINDKSMAIVLYKKTIELDPNYDNAYNNLGVIYIQLNNKKEALEMFKKTLEINPQSTSSYNNLGSLYYEINKKEEAFTFFKKALEINPDYPDAWYNLAVAYYYEKQYGLAIEHCDRAIRLGHKVSPDFLKILQPYRK